MNQKLPADTSGADQLLEAIGTTEEQLLARLHFLEFDDKDAALLADLHDGLNSYWEQFGERFYGYVNSFPALHSQLDAQSLERLKQSQSAYFSALSKGSYDKAYVRERIASGITHQRIGLSPEWYLGAYRKYLTELIPTLSKITGNDFARFEAAFSALVKVIFFDIGIALDTYFAAGNKALVDQKQYEEQLAFQTTHDRLTGLPNGALLKERLQEAIRQADSAGYALALLMLDIDDFQSVNDSIEHMGGDELLRAFAQRLNTCIGKADIVARLGGDKFAVVLNLADPSRSAKAVSESLFAALGEPFTVLDRSLAITCCIGAALYPQDCKDAAALLKYAGKALRAAKESGRGSCLFFSNELNQRILERVTLENELHSAIRANQLRLDYQPIADLQTGQLAGLEALVRWEHPDLGLIQPLEFIPLAEESELIDSIGEWVVQQACRDMRIWNDNGFPGIKVSLNVSTRQFRDMQLADKIEAALSDAGVEPSLLSLEITESLLMQNTSWSEKTLGRLKDLGILLALDDFGTGYSSLSYLKNFPFEVVKIDLSFIRNVVNDTNDAAITKAIISMAHSLGIRVVAKGVETEDQCEFLRRHMCDEIQGFFYSMPLPPKEIEALLREGRRLPQHLLRMKKPTRTLLLVDDEANILSSLKRLFRRDEYQILSASSGPEGLELLGKHDVDVIVSDQRMPGMTGVEFLRAAKGICPNTVRIVLSGFTELQSVTDAINEGAIYKFLTKPWEDSMLREHIEEAFRHKEMADENLRLDLEVRTANQELASTNRKMEEVLKQKQQQITRNEVSLDIVREILQQVSMPLLGLDESDMVAFANGAAEALFAGIGPILGSDAKLFLPELFQTPTPPDAHDDGARRIELDGAWYIANANPMGRVSQSRGKLIILTRCESTL